MSVSKLNLAIALLCIPTLLTVGGCACGKASRCCAAAPEPRHESHAPIREAPPVALVAQDLPPNAKPGECYAKVFVPEQFGSKEETVCVREASERLEVVPARYEWVEERVVVKEASTVLQEVPAEFALKQQRIQTDPGHSGWHVEKTAACATDANLQWAAQMYCLVNHEPEYQMLDTQVQVKPVTVREVVIPAEYQTVRRQKLVAPATTQRIPVPAEYAKVQKTFKMADSRVEWRRVTCEDSRRTETSNADWDALATAADSPQPLKDESEPKD